MSTFGIYSGKEVNLNFAGLTLDEMRDDEFWTLEPDMDQYEDEMSIDGGVTRFATGNTMFTGTLKLKRSSNTNQKLSAALNVDLLAAGGAGVGPLVWEDPNGATLGVANNAWIKGYPKDMGASKAVGVVSWVFRLQIPEGALIVGGNQLT